MHVVKAAFSGWQCVQRDWNPSIYRDAPRQCPYLERASMRHSRLHLVQLSMANGKIAWRRCRHDEATRWQFGHVVDRLRGASQSAVTAAMTSAREGGTPVSLVACRWSFIGLPEHRLTVPPARCAASLLPGNHALSKRSGCHWTSPALYLLRVRGFVHACVIRRRGIHRDGMSVIGRDVTHFVAVMLKGVSMYPRTAHGAPEVGNGCTLADRTSVRAGMDRRAIHSPPPRRPARWLRGVAC